MLCLIGLGVAEQIAGFHFMHMYIYMKSVKEYITPFFQFVYWYIEKIYSQKKVAYKTPHAVSNLRGLDGRGQLKTILIS